jgi:uncharacterized protein
MDNQVDYFEIGTSNPEASQAFYSGLFGWTISEPSPVGYRMIESDRGGLWDTTSVGGQNWAIFYVRVDDVSAAVERATSLGATVALPLVDNGTIEFAQLLDPLGSRFAVWKPKNE